MTVGLDDRSLRALCPILRRASLPVSLAQGSALVGKDAGFFVDFGIDDAENKAKLAQLRSDRWVNEGTAWARADFVVYNSNVGLFVAVAMKAPRPTGRQCPGQGACYLRWAAFSG